MSQPLSIAARGDAEVVITRMFDAPRHLVFAAFTVPALVRRWLLGPDGWTMPVCDIDLRVGGRFRYVWRNADGAEMAMGGVYREIVAPERIVTADMFDEDWTGGETLNTVTLTEAGGRTIVTTTIIYSSTAARDAALRTGMADGMEAGYRRLDAVFADQLAGEAAR